MQRPWRKLGLAWVEDGVWRLSEPEIVRTDEEARFYRRGKDTADSSGVGDNLVRL